MQQQWKNVGVSNRVSWKHSKDLTSFCMAVDELCRCS